MKAEKKYLIVGVGNLLYGDDALGPLLAESLAECGANSINAETDAFTSASYIEGSRSVIFLDVFDPSYGPEGEVVRVRIDPRKLSREELSLLISRETGAHDVTPAHIVALAYASGTFNGEAWVIGPVVKETMFGQPPSNIVINSIEKILGVLEETLHEKLDKDCVRKRFSEKIEELKKKLF
ncbi:hydrogenase maturation protease [Infirmifilum uzonense]|uniref:hydrogenase maturation protease n=1 Tax=Infirmifilum uzonense TaxID=1550241 RepID=UPI000699E2B5|nr:hydrogenase maturation protease [Infirmifilum uzonense]